jgi:hypothetical protein
MQTTPYLLSSPPDMVEHMFDTKKPKGITADAGIQNDPVLAVRLSLASLSSEDREGWLESALSARVVELMEIRERLDAEILRLVGVWDRDRAWEIDGALSPRSWLAHRTSVTDVEAGRLVKSARIVERHDGLSAALADGDITVGHVSTIARFASKEREPLLADHEETLVQEASRLAVGDFATVMRHWASLADDQLARDSFMNKWERRRFNVSASLDGWSHIDGFIDPEGAEIVTTALDHIEPPDPEDVLDGPRSLAQRRADALVGLASRYLKGERFKGVAANINAVIDVATAAGVTPDAAQARCELEGAGAVARSVLEQMACNASFTRVVMAGPSKVLDVGRSSRYATPSQRKALLVRDRHCRAPGCRRRANWCDAHHIDGWVDDMGETNIDNLVLLCRRHHTLLHNGKWIIKRTKTGGFEFSRPTRAP